MIGQVDGELAHVKISVVHHMHMEISVVTRIIYNGQGARVKESRTRSQNGSSRESGQRQPWPATNDSLLVEDWSIKAEFRKTGAFCSGEGINGFVVDKVGIADSFQVRAAGNRRGRHAGGQRNNLAIFFYDTTS